MRTAISIPSGVAWGMLGNAQEVDAARFFNGALTNGQRFVITMDNGFVPSGQQVGFFLQNIGGETRMQFIIDGASPTYNVGAATTVTNTDEGLRIEVELVDIDHANVFVTKLVSGTQTVVSNLLLNAGVAGSHQISAILLDQQERRRWGYESTVFQLHVHSAEYQRFDFVCRFVGDQVRFSQPRHRQQQSHLHHHHHQQRPGGSDGCDGH